MPRTSATTASSMLLPVLLVLGQAMPSPSPSTASNIEQAVRRASASEVHALLAKDVNALARIWSDDLVVTNPLNKLVTKQQVLALIESDTLEFRSYDRRIEYVHRYGDIAVIAGSETVVWAGKMPLAGRPSTLRFTAVWQERGGRWQEVARHANVVSELSPCHCSRRRAR